MTILGAVFLSPIGICAQGYHLFADQVKREYPSVVYDFLESYLFRIDSLQNRGQDTERMIRDDKVIFITGTASSARKLSPETPFSIGMTGERYYEVCWTDSLGAEILHLAFPMQYELLLGKPKVEIEKSFRQEVEKEGSGYAPCQVNSGDFIWQADGSAVTKSTNYYIESLTDAKYYNKVAEDKVCPIFTGSDKYRSASNLFQGCLAVDSMSDYRIYIEQNLYGFKKMSYTISLSQLLSYFQAMKLTTYFAIETESGDGLKALLIAHSRELGFNHMFSIIIPLDFVTKKNSVFKATLNAYIPTQNVKDLYQQYIEKQKKKI